MFIEVQTNKGNSINYFPSLISFLWYSNSERERERERERQREQFTQLGSWTWARLFDGRGLCVYSWASGRGLKGKLGSYNQQKGRKKPQQMFPIVIVSQCNILGLGIFIVPIPSFYHSPTFLTLPFFLHSPILLTQSSNFPHCFQYWITSKRGV